MQKKIINMALLVSLVVFSACKQNQEAKIPAGVLNKDEFAKVLADFALAESATNMNIKDVAVFKIDSTYAFNPLKENKITQAVYDSSIAFYAAHSELYKEVYETALTVLSNMQTRRDSLKTQQALKQKRDTAKASPKAAMK